MAWPATQSAEASEGLAVRLARLPPVLLVVTGLCLGVLGLAVVEWVGEPRFAASRYFLFMMPLYPVAMILAVRTSLAALGALPLAAEERQALRLELSRLPLRWVLASCAAGIATHLAVLAMIGTQFSQRPPNLQPGQALVIAAGWSHILIFSMAVAWFLRQGVVFLGLGRRIGPVDLLDVSALAPFVQVALRLTLMMALLASGMIAFHVDWERLRLAPQLALIAPLWLVFQGLIFVFPLWGVHASMRRERDLELARVNAAIRGDRRALDHSLLAREAASLSTLELLQYRSEVQAFPTWPFGVGALARLGLYVVIPVLGWVAAALVERVVDAALAG